MIYLWTIYINTHLYYWPVILHLLFKIFVLKSRNLANKFNKINFPTNVTARRYCKTTTSRCDFVDLNILFHSISILHHILFATVTDLFIFVIYIGPRPSDLSRNTRLYSVTNLHAGLCR